MGQFERRHLSTGRTLLTDFNGTLSTTQCLDLGNRADLEKLLVELQGLLEQRHTLETRDPSTKSKAAKALWLDRLAEIDSRFRLENFVDKVIATEIEHPNTDLFNRIFDLLDVLRNDASIDSANINNIQVKELSNRDDILSNQNIASKRSNGNFTHKSQIMRIPTHTSHNNMKRQGSFRSNTRGTTSLSPSPNHA